MKQDWRIIIVFLLLIFVTFGVPIYEGYQISSADCNIYVGIIKSVNGITDKDSGFFSHGDTSTTTLLFEDGLLITLDYRIRTPIRLGEPMTLKKCVRNDGKTEYRLN